MPGGYPSVVVGSWVCKSELETFRATMNGWDSITKGVPICEEGLDKGTTLKLTNIQGVGRKKGACKRHQEGIRTTEHPTCYDILKIKWRDCFKKEDRLTIQSTKVNSS